MKKSINQSIETKPADQSQTTLDSPRFGISIRAFIIGIIATAAVDLWIHYAELVLGAHRGHSALANTSIPFGAFNVLFALVIINLGITALAPRFRLSQAELLTIYVMCTVSTVLSSSGGLHFLIPTITAVHYFANADNGWAQIFFKLVPDWIAQSDPVALKSFYGGNSGVDISKWWVQITAWSGFMFLFACATLCLSMILRKQWIEREHLTFPTVQVPLELAKEGSPLLRNKLFWLGMGLTFGIVWLNTMALNYPNVPYINLRVWAIGDQFTTPPLDSLKDLKLSFFPFVIGIGYLLSTDVVFSCWFFYLFGLAESYWVAISGINTNTTATPSTFPYIPFQGAGAFLALALVSIWVSRKHLADVFRAAFQSNGKYTSEKLEYKISVFGLIACILGMVLFTVRAGASVPVAFIFIILVLIYLVAATRLRAETGNAWPVGPDIDAYKLMLTTTGSKAYSAGDLTSLTYVRAATACQDFRGTCMPHEFDGLKMADSAGINHRKLAVAMACAIAIGVVISFLIALFVWTKYGALAKTNAWRSMRGFNTFTQLSNLLQNPAPPDAGGMKGMGMGFTFTMLLSYFRMRYAWWPFHPIGYCMSNIPFASYSWTPFFIAWLCKVVMIRAGGVKLYKQGMPFFMGLIVGDLMGGGITTLIGCFQGGFNPYPVNW